MISADGSGRAGGGNDGDVLHGMGLFVQCMTINQAQANQLMK